MGSGKSSIGRVLAKDINMYFLDTDLMIESNEGKTIADIFSLDGEKYFRSLENKTVSWLSKNVNEAVISTGGGMLVYCEKLKDLGLVVYLKVSFETIIERMSKEELEKRPLFKNLTEAKNIYDERNLIYEEKADLIIDADDTIASITNKIKNLI